MKIIMLTKKIILFLSLLVTSNLYSQQSNSFYLIGPDRLTSLLIDPKEKAVVKTAVEMFSNDMKTVGNGKVNSYNSYSPEPSCLIVAGTIGTNVYIDSLISKGLFSVEEINNKWEAFKIKI